MGLRGKRMRGDVSASTAGSDAGSDGEGGGGGGGLGGAAERKRELERNRRNLVNVRFQELEGQLAALPGAPSRVQRRLDKEVVLKDAAQSLASQQRDLDDALQRIASMTAEIAILRSEKLELRHDKAFLHKEVAAARADNAALAADNVALWQHFRKTAPSKLPVGITPRTSALRRPAPASAPSPSPPTAPPPSARAEPPSPPPPLAARAKPQQLQPQMPPATPPPAPDADLLAAMSAALEAAPPGLPKPEALAPDEFLKAQEFPLRELASSLMVQYGFEEQQRELEGFEIGLDDVGQPELPDIAPCG